MTDKPQPSHWESLAKELGAEFGPVEAPPRPLPAAPPARATRRTSKAPRPENRPTADWSQLANELGATPSAESLRRSEPSIANRSEPARASLRRASSGACAGGSRAEPRRDEEIREAEFALDRLDDERIEFEVEEADEAIEFSAQSTEEEGPESPPRDSERRGGRRRRRRRGRGKSAERRRLPREPEVWDVESAPAR